MRSIDIKNNEFPHNFLNDLLEYFDEDFKKEFLNNLPDDLLGSLRYVMCTALTDREGEIVRLRYEEKMTYSKIGEMLGISAGRVQQITHKTLRKVRHPNYFRYVQYGVKEVLRMTVESSCDAAVKKYKDKLDDAENYIREYVSELESFEKPVVSILNTHISDLGLDVRSYNVLQRNNIVTVGDILNVGYENVSRFRNAGRKVMEDITKSLQNIGVVFQ